MTFAPRPAYPVVLWEEPPTLATTPLVAVGYWHFDGTTWTLTNDLTQESGKLANPLLDGIYVLTLVGALGPTTPLLRTAIRAGDYLIY